ncbi:MAG: transcriptional regulator, Crp/Fnr family [uncultured Cytophagales bacterium]|uniref:Transcriptional regulator, Crp/Fnr family n=1 Tax=uncultured Cytophagales bacterium TaxID=158755 RepID=A0A6J4IIV2_9SPHI|nr:MAG: transcriptional regulator, Crp/Fnr family [uncultured Cytophagales bacterium]
MKKILIIEDNNDVRENTAEILELAGYQVFTAPNGKRGVEAARAERPDLVICDIMMPELDGYGVLHLLGKSPDTAAIPFIFLTAKAEKDDFRKGMNLGADDYLTKPFDDLALLDAVEMRLRKSGLRGPAGTADAPAPAGERRGLEEFNRLLGEERKVLTAKKKHRIFTEGNFANSLYYVKDGKVKTFKTNKEGREFITGLHGEGDFIGYLELLENRNYTESAEALEDAQLVVIQKPDFYDLIERNRDVAAKFIKLLSRNVIEHEDRLLKLAYNSVRKRVAEALLMLCERYQPDNPAAAVLRVSREDLSGLAGASKETVIRTLSDFKDEKLIDITGKEIHILKFDKLKTMPN